MQTPRKTAKLIWWIVGIGAVVALAWFGSNRYTNLNQQNKNQSASLTSANFYNDLLDLTSGDPELWRFPARYICGSSSIETDANQVAKNHGLMLVPNGKILPQTASYGTSTNGLWYIDAVFNQDCSKVYFVDNNDNVKIFDVALNAITSVNIPISALPSDMPLQPQPTEGSLYQPEIYFAYPITDSRLFIATADRTTGGDVYSNLTEQAVYDMATKKLTFLSGGDAPLAGMPVLFDYKTKTLIYPDASYVATEDSSTIASEPPSHRIEINLVTGERKSFPLKNRYIFTPACEPNGFISQADYTQCRDSQLNPLFDSN